MWWRRFFSKLRRKPASGSATFAARPQVEVLWQGYASKAELVTALQSKANDAASLHERYYYELMRDVGLLWMECNAERLTVLPADTEPGENWAMLMAASEKVMASIVAMMAIGCVRAEGVEDLARKFSEDLREDVVRMLKVKIQVEGDSPSTMVH